jgi:gas vesicle protein
MNVYLQIENIYKQLGNDLLLWAKGVEQLFEQVSKKLTASLSWEFINKQLKRKIEKWYNLVQDAVDETELILVENDIYEITPEIKDHIRKVFEPKLKEYQIASAQIIAKYESVASNLNPKAWVELTDILFEIKIDNIISILCEVFDES